MPTADASQFTQMRKLQAAQARVPGITNKMSTHLSQPLYTATGLSVFLPSFSGKKSSFTTFNRINVSNARHSKLKIPGGNVFGFPREVPVVDGGSFSNAGGRAFDGGTPSNSGGRIYDGGQLPDPIVPVVTGGSASAGTGSALSGGSAGAAGGTTYSGGGP